MLINLCDSWSASVGPVRILRAYGGSSCGSCNSTAATAAARQQHQTQGSNKQQLKGIKCEQTQKYFITIISSIFYCIFHFAHTTVPL